MLVASARAAARDRTAAFSPEQIAAAVARFPELNFAGEHGRAQRDVLERLGTGGRLGVAIGVAGSGKTSLLKPLVSAWQEEGRTVHGIALAWRQSDDLAEAGIPTQNTRRSRTSCAGCSATGSGSMNARSWWWTSLACSEPGS